MYRKVAAALVAALALGIASCGGSESELTRAQLVRRVETACIQGQRAAERRQQAAGRSASGDAFVASVAAGQEVALDRMEDLNAPDAIKDDFDAFKQGMHDRLELLQRVASVDRADIQDAIRGIQTDVEAATRRLTAAAASLGIEGCA